jgi:hypothetical protein
LTRPASRAEAITVFLVTSSATIDESDAMTLHIRVLELTAGRVPWTILPTGRITAADEGLHGNSQQEVLATHTI